MKQKPSYRELENRIIELEKALDLQKGNDLPLDQTIGLPRLSDATFEAVFLSEKGRCIDQNLSAEKMFGYTRQEALGRPGTDWLIPGDRDIVKQHMALDCADPYEVTALHKNGTIFPCEIQARTIRLGGRTIRITALRDISLRKKSEKALKASEQKWRNILLNTPQIGISLDPGAKIIFANEHFLRLTGWEKDEILGKDWFDLFIPHAIREDVRDIFLTVMAQKHTHGFSTYENDILTKTGDLRHISWSNVLTLDPLGHVLDVTCLGIDLTERIRAERNLRISEERLNLALDSVSDAVWDWNLGTGEVYFSSRWYTMLGYEPHELPQSFETWKNLVHPEDVAMAEEKVFTHLKLAKPFEVEFRMKTKDNQWRWILARGKTVKKDESGKALRMLGTHVDITDRKMLEKRIQQTQKMESLGTLAGGIAHDFNNILFPIIGMAELLMEDFPPKSPEHDNAKEIFNAGKRGGDLVKQILSFSRQSKNILMPAHPHKILKEVLKLTRSTIPRNVDIIKDIPKTCPLILADPTQFHQIGMNLITNAFHAVENKNGKIAVRLKEVCLDQEGVEATSLEPGRFVRLSVSDNGMGMAPDVMNKIFEPYFTTKGQEKGTGLGLSVVYGIVKECKGEIKVSSRPGRGSLFEVFFPVHRERAPDFQGAREAAPMASGMERILLVDDEIPVARLEKIMLERLGYQVSLRTDSTYALEAFRSNPFRFDLVVSDMTMPGMTGDVLAQNLLAIRPDIPVIICTGYSQRLDAAQKTIPGVRGILMKPVDKSEMARMVRSVLDGT